MFLRKILLLVGISVLLAGCASTQYRGGDSYVYSHDDTKSLGVRYLLGRGVQQDDKKAFYYFRKAANEGDPFAQNELAYLYAAGKGTSQDYIKSLTWYKKAADQGLSSAQYNLGLMYGRGLGTPRNQKEARIWLQKSAAQGFEPARIALRQMDQ
jgi:TPR repeat protein